MKKRKPLKRPPGMGSVFLRGRVWWVRVPGEKKQSTHSTEKRDAEELLAKLLGERHLGKLVPEHGRATYEDLESLLLTDMRANGRRSMDNVEKWRLPHLRQFFGGMRVRDIAYDTVNAFVARRLVTAKRATVSQEVKHLKRMFVLAHRAGKVDRVPAFPTVAVGDNARKGFVEPDAMRRVIQLLPDHAKGPVLFMYLTGWRTSEVLGLKWGNVDFREGVVRLNAEQSKSGKPRQFPFTKLPELDALLRKQHARSKAEARKRGAIVPEVFPYRGDELGSFRGAWRTAVKEAGVPGLRPHDLRRSAARNLVRAGVSEGVVMRLCGWSTRSMFDRYNVVDARDLVEGTERLNGFLEERRRAGEKRV